MFRRAPPKIGYDILVETQLSSEFWEAGEIPIESKAKFLKKISEIKEAVHKGCKLNDLLGKFRKICSKYPIPVQRYVDAVGFVRIEVGAVRRTISSKISITRSGKTRCTTLQLQSPPSEMQAPTCPNEPLQTNPSKEEDNEPSDDESSDDDKDDPTYDFSVVEQLPIKVLDFSNTQSSWYFLSWLKGPANKDGSGSFLNSFIATSSQLSCACQKFAQTRICFDSMPRARDFL